MLTLSTLIGKGLHRECFIHPSDPSKCVKIVVNGNNQETQREQNYYHFLARKRVAMTMLPIFYGNVKTNMGIGAVFDLIRDSDGSISHSLAYYLTNNYPPATIIIALEKLKQYLLDNNIITMSIQSKNILYQQQGNTSYTLWLVDGVGNANFMPFANHIRYLGRKKILRRWHRFYETLKLT